MSECKSKIFEISEYQSTKFTRSAQHCSSGSENRSSNFSSDSSKEYIEVKADPSVVMNQRFERLLKSMPECDQVQYAKQKENPLGNSDSDAPK